MEVLQTISTLPEGWEATSPPKPFDFCEPAAHPVYRLVSPPDVPVS